MNGLQMAAAYSMKPNELRRCGPEGSHRQLYDFVTGQNQNEEEVRNLLSRFEVATPYYALIAGAKGIKDKFDQKVVEAYWLGNDFLDKVSQTDVKRVIEKDVKREGWNTKQIALLFSAMVLKNARPHHSLSVLYFFTRPGSKMALGDVIKERCDNCRICWGEVLGVDKEKILVRYQPLKFNNGNQVSLDDFSAKLIDRGFITEARRGDLISFHLEWGIEKLSKKQAGNLSHYTSLTLEALNS